MRWFVRSLIVGVGLFAAVAAALYVWLLGSLPETGGRVAIAGLNAPVEIIRDRHGVPHIYAGSQMDAVFGLGFVHAQDRLWQMEMSRRIGQGRLSEIMGEATVATDRFLRTLSVYHYAERNYDTLNREGRARLDAYAAGVNAYLASRRGPLPPEFLILRHRPEPWRPADSLVWGKMMAWSLSGNWVSELLRARLAGRLSAEQIADLFAPYPGDGRVVLPHLAAFYRALDLDGVSTAMPHRPDPANGSNNWVIAGDRSATTKPLLANDPHLGLAVPSVWYFAHLSAPGVDVIGATLPGVATVVLGRNRRIAWGFTNTGPDVQDLFIERIDPQNPANYLTPDGSRPFAIRREVLEVKGGADIPLTVRTSRHGPIMSDASASLAEVAGEGYVMALAWTALTDIDTTPNAFALLNEARNPEQFLEALRGYQTPQQNIVYADVDGNIGFYAPGRVPIRKAANAIKGLAPVPGWDATYDWRGFIPFEELPHLVQPPSGVIATANHKIVPEGYPHHITFEWEPPYRARRIDAVLAQHTTHSIDSFARLQSDETSMMAQDFLPFLRSVEPTSETAAQALNLVANWDGKMDRNMAAPLVFAAWYRELTRLVYADELGELFDDAWAMRPLFMFQVLSNNEQWCDNVTTAAPESCAEQATEALERALDWLADGYGADVEKWRWGEAHVAHSRHQPFTRVPVLRWLFDITLPAGGGAFTVNRGMYRIADPKAPFASVHGPSLRAIYDLADLDRSLYIHSTGQSGNPLSSLYRNFAGLWRDVEYIPMTTRRSDISSGALGTLWLDPKGERGERDQ